MNGLNPSAEAEHILVCNKQCEDASAGAASASEQQGRLGSEAAMLNPEHTLVVTCHVRMVLQEVQADLSSKTGRLSDATQVDFKAGLYRCYYGHNKP